MLSSSSSFHCSLHPPTLSGRLSNSNKRSTTTSIITCQRPRWLLLPHMPISLSPSRILELTFPLAASISILLWSNPAYAGFLSGSTGLESIAGPELPQIDFLKRWNENNQKRYSELDSKFKSSTVLKELLEKSKVNKESIYFLDSATVGGPLALGALGMGLTCLCGPGLPITFVSSRSSIPQASTDCGLESVRNGRDSWERMMKRVPPGSSEFSALPSISIPNPDCISIKNIYIPKNDHAQIL